VVCDAAAVPVTTSNNAQGKRVRIVAVRSIASANSFTSLPAAATYQLIPNKTLSGNFGCEEAFLPAGASRNPIKYQPVSEGLMKMLEIATFVVLTVLFPGQSTRFLPVAPAPQSAA
jgi:hypothetical protein